jgi:CheY-like chemotaxis protein
MSQTQRKIDTEAARGAEVLLLDGDERVRDGLRKLLSASGLVITATADVPRAEELTRDKFFAVAVLDIDTPETGYGLQLMDRLRESSPQTRVVLLSVRQTFEVAAQGFRAGAADVVVKSPENVRYLTEVVVRLCGDETDAGDRQRMIADTMEIHEQFLKRLMEASRRAKTAEDRAAGTSGEQGLERCLILVVDDNPRNAPGLQQALGEKSSFEVVSALTGGEALDFAGSRPFQIALVRNALPDLPASMVVNGLKSEVPEGIVLQFIPPGEAPGRVDIIEGSGPIELIAELRDGQQLVERVEELRQAYVAKLRERRYLRAFREEHYEFLRRYVELKQRLAKLLESERRGGA